MFLPELYALQHPNFFKFHAPTSSLARALFMYLLPLSGTHFLTAFVSVNLCQLSGNILKHIIFNWHSLASPLATRYPRASDSIFDFWRFINSFTYLTYFLKLSDTCVCAGLTSDVWHDSWRLGSVWEISRPFLRATHQVGVGTPSNAHVWTGCKFLPRDSIYMLIAIVCMSVCSSVCHTGGWVKNSCS